MRWHGRCRFGANGQHVGFMEFDRFGVLDCRSEKERESDRRARMSGSGVLFDS